MNIDEVIEKYESSAAELENQFKMSGGFYKALPVEIEKLRTISEILKFYKIIDSIANNSLPPGHKVNVIQKKLADSKKAIKNIENIRKNQERI